jgi:hypothetical protein
MAAAGSPGAPVYVKVDGTQSIEGVSHTILAGLEAAGK